MLPTKAGLAGLMLAALATGPDAQSLISRLAAPKYADRQAASAELAKLGIAAFPALRAARSDRDPEVRSRARLLLDEIERSSIVRPTLLKFEPGTYTLAEVSKKLGETQGVAISVDSTNIPVANRSLTITEPAELSVWQLVDRLGLSLQHEAEADYGRTFYRKTTSSNRLAPGPKVRSRTSDSGPIRMTVRTPFFARNVGSRNNNQARRFTGGASSSSDLTVPIDVTTEPRLSLRLSTAGPIRIIEAVDNLDRSLTTGATGEVESTAALNGDRAVSTLPIVLRLRSEGEAATSLKRIRGTIPLEIEARKIDPIVMSIPTTLQEDRRPVVCGAGTTIQVNGLTTSPAPWKGSPVIDLTIRREGWTGFARMGGRRMPGQLWEMVNADEKLWESIEVVDAQGHPFRAGTPRPISTEGDGIRIQLTLPPRDDNSVPTELRFYTTIKATRDIPFDFKDVSIR